MNEILKQIIELVEQTPSKSIEGVLAEKLAELGVSEECKKEIEQALKYIDSFEEKYNSLENARSEGKSRQKWLKEQVDKSLEGLKDDNIKVDIMNRFGTAIEKKMPKLYNQ